MDADNHLVDSILLTHTSTDRDHRQSRGVAVHSLFSDCDLEGEREKGERANETLKNM